MRPSETRAVISSELASFLESGVSILVGTRDARLLADCVRALGARVEGDDLVTVFVPSTLGEIAVANVGDNGRIAVCFTRIVDHKSYQLKGRVSRVQAGDDRDRRVIDRYRGEFAESLGFVGVPTRLTMRIAHWPCEAITFRVEEMFVQTPGPGAGDSVGKTSAGSRT